MTIFDGVYTAAQKEKTIAEKVKKLSELDVHLTIAAILFKEDAGSLLYTDLKREAAKRVGITYLVEHFSLNDDPKSIIKKIKSLNKNPAITGIIIQKPSRKIWISARTSSEEGT
ncbi:MAG: tetrahydrofolate dehydrogenase/cyclohydrolase catalytic domain-containing protein, partial [Microgenomates group bacterium]